MIIDFVRFKATDEVELQGWLSQQEGDFAALHVHGMGGNGYQNKFLDDVREMYVHLGVTFFAFDTRGFGIINDFRQGEGWKRGGSCFEKFEESIHDIRGAIAYLKSLGKTRFIIQGHSLGCSKVVNYLVNDTPSGIEKVILLAPTDMVAWANADPSHGDNIEKAIRLIADGKVEELVGAECWPLDKTPLSAQAYLSKSGAGGPVDIYGDRDGGPLLGKITEPLLIVYGDDDIGITHTFGDIERYKARLDEVKNKNTRLEVIAGSPHSFRGYEQTLVSIVEKFMA